MPTVALAASPAETIRESIIKYANIPTGLFSSSPDLVQAAELSAESALPAADDRSPHRTMQVEMTAYSSTVDQTDGDPFTTANGTRVKDGIVAMNGIPFGTRIRIPELYGDKVFIVTDRMNKRYTTRVDIWMETREEAIQFGYKRNVKIEIF